MKCIGQNNVVMIIDCDMNGYYEELTAEMNDSTYIRMNDNVRARDYFILNRVDIVLYDHGRDSSCSESLLFFKSVKPSVPVIVLAAVGSEELAVTAFRNGARDYFRKPFNTKELKKSICNALSFREGNFRRKSDYSVDGFRAAVAFIKNNYSTKLTLPNVARKAGMSVSCFERIFKSKMGLTFTMYVNDLRIKQAARMIEQGHHSTIEIALAVGFSNQFHFTRTFKKIMNTSPGVFRKSLDKRNVGTF